MLLVKMAGSSFDGSAFFVESTGANLFEQKRKGCPTDSLFNLNQLNLINHKLTRTVSLVFFLNFFIEFFSLFR